MIKKITFKSNTILISLIALSVSICNTCYASAGKLLFVNGDVLIQDLTGKQHKGQKGGELNEGDSVITSSNGFAQIRMDDGGAVSVRPESNFKITKFQFNGKTDGSEKSSFSLINGSIRAVTGVIGNAHRENYKIETATATIGVRGTGADLSSSQNGLGNYSASGSGQISSFTSSGIGLTGSGFTGSSTNATLISGRIQGGFVGSDAGGLISAFALSGLNGSKTENGILYLKK